MACVGKYLKIITFLGFVCACILIASMVSAIKPGQSQPQQKPYLSTEDVLNEIFPNYDQGLQQGSEAAQHFNKQFEELDKQLHSDQFPQMQQQEQSQPGQFQSPQIGQQQQGSDEIINPYSKTKERPGTVFTGDYGCTYRKGKDGGWYYNSHPSGSQPPQCPDTISRYIDEPIEKEPKTFCDKIKKEMDATVIKLRRLIKLGQIHPLWKDVAADNLERFLSGQGGVKIIDNDWFRSNSQVQDIEKSLRDDVNAKIEAAAPMLQDGESTSIPLSYPNQKIVYTRAFNFNELYWTSGSSQIQVEGVLQLSRTGNIIQIEAALTYHWEDPYDWHIDKQIFIPIPGFGIIKDSELMNLQACRGAKPFVMVSDWMNVLRKSIELRNR